MEAKTQDYASIGWAINHLRHGHKMRRTPWPTDTYVALDTTQGRPGTIKLFGPDTPQGTLFVNTNADLLLADWTLLDPTLPGEYHA